jgi:hypothetical protein
MGVVHFLLSHARDKIHSEITPLCTIIFHPKGILIKDDYAEAMLKNYWR